MVIYNVKEEYGIERRRIGKEFVMAVRCVDVHQVASVIKNRNESVLIIDSRSFIEHNACHISTAVNVCCSKIVKRRLQQDKLSVKELLIHTCSHCDIEEKLDVVVYDQSSKDIESIPSDSFILILLKKLQVVFQSVNLLSGGFNDFQKYYPECCEDKTRAPLTSLSQPCLPISGPTRILPFLYLGSQLDALNRDLLRDHNITYELNVSTSCPRPEFLPEGHFMRIPVNDTYNEKLLPFFPQAFHFLDKVREGSGCVLVHCLAGISRSPTVAIAYVMRYLHLSSDDGYRYVKSKRPTISPNFNFLGQLLEYEKQLRKESTFDGKPTAPPVCSKKRVCRTDMRTSKLSLDIDLKRNETNVFTLPRSGDQSPTTALAKLSFDIQNSPSVHEREPTDFKQFRSKSCYGDWLRDRDERKTKDCNAITKVLSPVKEIKCDALISEISTGQSERNLAMNKQRRQSMFCAREEKHSFSNVGKTACSERFSIHTLTHQSTFAYNDQQKVKSRLSDTFESKVFFFGKDETKKENLLRESGHRRILRVSPERLQNPKKEHPESQSKLSPFSFNSEQCNRSDSVGTSGFGSESSDYTDNVCETSKKPVGHDIDFDELEDDVLMRSGKLNTSLKYGANSRTFFSLSFQPETASEYYQNLESPLSPSESHLLEDLETEKDTVKTGPSSPCQTSSQTDDIEIFHDSGVPISPPWIWPNKGTTSSNVPQCSPTKDKRQPFKEPISTHQFKFRTFWYNKNSYESRMNEQSLNRGAYSDKVGLYRVQSCPGIISYESSFCMLAEQSQKYSRKDFEKKDILSHESCPDVLHLRDNFESQRQRDFRRNVRTIQVS
ncbi:uncharacterized protein [Parasteatoda tepidariorum]|uniref:uncharacterized protein isoform X1 n=2 Tax=Parasteatoda tepidariorum TaxID=114398 RepID=UPI001C71DFF9|nr:uncharacterized protein LOC107456875 isoform X1 [Parasteatoda tepidariorum]